MFGRKSAILIASTAAAFCATAMVVAPPGHADGAFAAIAYAPPGSAGWAVNKSSRAEAEQAALKDCSNFNSGCQAAAWREGGCVTIAWNKSDGKWSGGGGATTAEAESDALSKIPNGIILHTACNG